MRSGKGLAIVLGPGKPGRDEDDDDDDAEEGDEDMAAVKDDAVDALMSALKKNDSAGVKSALESFFAACSEEEY